MNIITKISLITSISLFISSCLNVENYPIEPAILFSEYTLTDTTDALGNNIKLFELTIEFTDGDGDIGLEESDTILRLTLQVFIITTYGLHHLKKKTPFIQKCKPQSLFMHVFQT